MQYRGGAFIRWHGDRVLTVHLRENTRVKSGHLPSIPDMVVTRSKDSVQIAS